MHTIQFRIHLEKVKVMELEEFTVNNIRCCYTTLQLDIFYIGKKCKKLLKYVQS